MKLTETEQALANIKAKVIDEYLFNLESTIQSVEYDIEKNSFSSEKIRQRAIETLEDTKIVLAKQKATRQKMIDTPSVRVAYRRFNE